MMLLELISLLALREWLLYSIVYYTVMGGRESVHGAIIVLGVGYI